MTKSPSGGILPITEYGNAITILDTLIESQEYWMDTSLNITRYKNTIKAGGSTARAQNVEWVSGVEWSGYPLDCYDYVTTCGAKKEEDVNKRTSNQIQSIT